MNACHECPREFRTARFNLPISQHFKLRNLLAQLVAPSLRLHRYRNLSAEMLEKTLVNMDSDRCK